MDEQALNKKLAEWIGFRLLYRDIEDKRSWYWVQPDGQTQSIQETLPAFPYSLDACFKWLVPKLDNVVIAMNVAPSEDVFWNAHIEAEYKTANTSETPALALCLAIEKLIDSQVTASL